MSRRKKTSKTQLNRQYKALDKELGRGPVYMEYRMKYGDDYRDQYPAYSVFKRACGGLTVAEQRKAKLEKAKDETLAEYVDLTKSLGRRPRMRDMSAALYQRVRSHFGRGDTLTEAALQDKILARRFVRASQLPGLELEHRSAYIVTSAMANVGLNTVFLRNLRRYAKHIDAQIVVMTVTDPAHQNSEADGWYPREIADSLTDQDHSINKNLTVLGSIEVTAKQAGPLTGLARFAHQECSLVVGSPKQDLEFVPNGIEDFPKAVMSTGTISLPDYNTTLARSKRTAKMAEYDHVYGAIVVRRVDDTYFHFRQIQSDETGVFYDLNRKITHRGITKHRPSGMVLGDWHAGLTDPVVRDVTVNDMVPELAPRHLVTHDLFDDNSQSPHENKSVAKQARNQVVSDLAPFGTDLDAELDYCADEIRMFLKLCASVGCKLIGIQSNHDLHLCRTIEDGSYSKDKENWNAWHRIAQAYGRGEDPFFSEMLHRGVNFDYNWVDISRQIEGVEVGQHGHLGSNGSNASPAQLEKSWGDIMCGHRHTPGIKRSVWHVGTSTRLRLRYTHGASSWCHTHGLIHPGGRRQLINILPTGEWK